MITNLEDFSEIFSKECPICCEEYTNAEKKPIVMDCGHTICIICLSLIYRSQKKCPFDKMKLNQRLETYPINWTFLEILNSKIFITSYK